MRACNCPCKGFVRFQDEGYIDLIKLFRKHSFFLLSGRISVRLALDIGLPGRVIQAYNPSDLGGGDQEDHSSKPP
jgi:hypothetical protein